MKKKLSTVLLALAAFMPMTAQNLVKGDYGYLYCHMSDKGEWTAYAVSRDGYNYQDINEGKPIFDPEEHARIEGGTRDAYITRMHNGKGYIMVTTDRLMVLQSLYGDLAVAASQKFCIPLR